MTNDIYRAPAARAEDPPHDRLLGNAPLEVRIAIVLSWFVLAVDSFNGFWQIYADPETSVDLQFSFFWIAITSTSTAITALFIFQASRRRNWGRIALLLWTLGSWCLWIFWRQGMADYTWWKWLLSGTLIAMEFAVLVLLFLGDGARWYTSVAGKATNAL